MNDAKFVDPLGNPADPVEFVKDLWMRNTLPSIAMDAIGQFMLVNILEALGPYDRPDMPEAGKRVTLVTVLPGLSFQDKEFLDPEFWNRMVDPSGKWCQALTLLLHTRSIVKESLRGSITMVALPTTWEANSGFLFYCLKVTGISVGGPVQFAGGQHGPEK